MPGVYNLQIKVKEETHNLFKETFNQSGADNNAGFLKMLLDNYISDEVKIKEVPVNNPDLVARLEAYEKHPVIRALYEQNKGKKFSFRDNRGNNREVTINSLFDVFEVIMSKTYSE